MRNELTDEFAERNSQRDFLVILHTFFTEIYVVNYCFGKLKKILSFLFLWSRMFSSFFFRRKKNRKTRRSKKHEKNQEKSRKFLSQKVTSIYRKNQGKSAFICFWLFFSRKHLFVKKHKKKKKGFFLTKKEENKCFI